MQTQYPSAKTLRRHFRRHALRHWITWIAMSALVAGLLFHFFYFTVTLLGLGDRGINLLFGACAIVLAGTAIGYLVEWGRQGFRLGSFTRRWEKLHPEVSSRPSLLVYAQNKPDEVARLGYSHELLAAEDEWLNEYIQASEKRAGYEWPFVLAGALAVVLTASALLLTKQPGVRSNLERIEQALLVREDPVVVQTLKVPGSLDVERGKPVVLTASAAQPLGRETPFIHLGDRTTWQSIPAQEQQGKLTYTIPAVHRNLVYYFSSGPALSNQGKIDPLDPPRLTQGTVTLESPAYTGRPKETLPSLAPFSMPEGSLAQVYAKAASPLKSADFYFNDIRQPVVIQDGAVQGAFTSLESGEFYFHLIDSHNLKADSQRIRVTVVPDATPTAEVMGLPAVSDIPELLVLRVSVHVHDDYRVQRVIAHSQLNEKDETKRADLVWDYTPEKAKEVGSATDVFITFDWDLSQLNLFPGDELRFQIEVSDNDGIHGPKSGWSQSHLLRYPSLADVLDDLEQFEQEQAEDLSNVSEKQDQITKDAEKTLEKISEKLEQAPSDPKDRDLWTEKQELEALKERQEELVEEAKKIEENLQEYQEQAEQGLNPEEKEEQGFTPETLEKMDRIRSLLQDLVDKDSQQLIQKIEQTVEQMSQQMTQEQIDQLNFSFQDFNQQLDRTLSMLENTQQTRQLEGLKEMASELAERQDHLERETENLSEEKKALEEQLSQLEQNKPPESAPAALDNPQSAKTEEQKAEEQAEAAKEMAEWQAKKDELQKKLEEIQKQESLMADRQERVEQDTQNMMEKMGQMQESLQEKNPALAQQLEKLQQQAQEGQMQQQMSQATQKLQQGQPQQAKPHQQSAEEQLKQLAQQMEQSLESMQGMDMQMDTQGLKRLVDRGLFLSNEFEPLTEAQSAQDDPLISIRKAQAFQREMGRIETQWKDMAQTNPFLGRTVQSLLQRSQERLQKGVTAGQGERWVGIHEGRQSLIALNQAIFQMMQDMQQMQQQQQQSGMEGMQQMMQQMISEQQGLQQMLQQMRQMGEQGEKMMQQLQQMAQQQAQIRKEIEKMMQSYRHAKQMRNRLDGIYQEMKEVEDMLQNGQNGPEVEEKQNRIMTRMLEAGTMQEKDEYGDERKAEAARTGAESVPAAPDVPMNLKEKLQNAVDRPAEENIPVQYREAIKNHFLHLAEQMGQ